MECSCGEREAIGDFDLILKDSLKEIVIKIKLHFWSFYFYNNFQFSLYISINKYYLHKGN